MMEIQTTREKICNFCKKLKPLKEFYNKHDTKDGKTSVCKNCQKTKDKTRYNKRKNNIIQNTKNKRLDLQNKINYLKSKPCQDCGIQYEPYCMDFDHLIDKKMSISKMVHECYSLSSIKSEIEKCELVCVLCHKTRTHKRKVKNHKHKFVKRNFDFINQIKEENPCTICGLYKSFYHMEFDHLYNKKKNISHMAAQKYSLKSINEEIRKCQLLCSLCHRRKTAIELWNY